MDDLRQGRILTDTGCPAFQIPGSIDCCCADRIAFCFVHGNGFPCEGGFVNSAGTFQHDPVHRDVRAGAYHKQVAGLYFLYRNFCFGSVPQQYGSFRRQAHQAFQRVCGPAFGPCLQHLADGDQRGNHSGGLKVQLVVIQVHQLHIGSAGGNHSAHFIEDIQAPAEGNGRAQ